MASRQLPGSRQPRQRGRKRTLLPVILRAAAGLFARSGFEQTMEDVAKAAGVRKATLYSYFDSKPALIDAVVEGWLRAIPVVHPMDRRTPLRQQLIDAGLELQKLAAHPAAVSLNKQLAGFERRVSPRNLETWQKRIAGFENCIAGLLQRHCGCECPNQVAHQFLLLVTGDPSPESAGLRIPDTTRIESAVELILRAYPERQVNNH